MPAGQAFDHRAVTMEVMGDDGTWSDKAWIATNEAGAIVLSADHVRHACGDDAGERVHIPVATMWQGEVVALDGVPTDKMPEGYALQLVPTGKEAKALRAQMAALCPLRQAGQIAALSARFNPVAPRITWEEPAPIAEIEAVTVPVEAAPLPVESEAPAQDAEIPAPASPTEAIEPLDVSECQIEAEAPCEAPAGENDAIAKMAAMIAELTGRIVALEAVSTTSPESAQFLANECPGSAETGQSQGVDQAKGRAPRTPAQIRLLKRYLAMRARRDLDNRALGQTVLTCRDLRADLERAQEHVESQRIVAEQRLHLIHKWQDKRERAVRAGRKWSRVAWEMTRKLDDECAKRDAEITRLQQSQTYLDSDGTERRDLASDAYHQGRAALDKSATLSGELASEREKIATMAERLDTLSGELMDWTGRALRAETALKAVEARANGWPPAAVCIKSVTFAANGARAA